MVEGCVFLADQRDVVEEYIQHLWPSLTQPRHPEVPARNARASKEGRQAGAAARPCTHKSGSVSATRECPLCSKIDRIAAPPRLSVTCQSRHSLHRRKASRLYKQKRSADSSASPLEIYVRRWLGWVEGGIGIDRPNPVNARTISNIAPSQTT